MSEPPGNPLQSAASTQIPFSTFLTLIITVIRQLHASFSPQSEGFFGGRVGTKLLNLKEWY